jgi:hypothetical protein
MGSVSQKRSLAIGQINKGSTTYLHAERTYWHHFIYLEDFESWERDVANCKLDQTLTVSCKH